MVTSDLGACEWFVWDLRRSGLIDRGQLDSIVSEFLKKNPRAEAPALAEYLVHQGTLTAFQAERVLNGKSQGLVLGPYVLLDAIGSGSMGQVYKATSKNDNVLYAVKVLPRRSMWNVRLARRQVRSFGGFSHAAVVPFVDVGTAGGLHYLVWPLVDGTTLEELVQQSGRLAPNLAAHYGMHIAQGLNVSHENNLFHGLVKPSNIMVGPDNQARILDFGIGSLLVENEGESLVDTMSTANTLTSGLDCASPECIMEPTNRTPAGDQYSLGCVLYFCLTGQVPFPEGSAVEKMMAHQTKEPAPIRQFAPEVPEGLAAVVNKLMAKLPEARYGGCDQVVEALEAFAGDARPVAAAAPVGARAGGSAHKMAGLPSRAAAAHKAPAMVPSTPAPSHGRVPTPPPLPSRLPAAGTPAPPPMKKAAAVPTRDTLQPPPFAEELPDDPVPVPQPPARRGAAKPPAAPPGRSTVAPSPAKPPSRTSTPGLPTKGAPAAPAGRGAPPAKAPPGSKVTTPAKSSTASKAPPAKGSAIPPGWADEDAAAAPARSFGPIGLVAAALLLMVIVYLGATMFLKQQ
jgi:serine/threonine-protein kinase